MSKVKHPDLFSIGSDICYDHEESLRILKSMNSVISGLSSMSDINYVFDLLNSSTDVREVYSDLVKAWNIDLYDISCKVEILRNLIFAETVEWRFIEKELKDYSQKCIEYGGGAE